MNPVAFEIGNLSVRWYGIIMALAFLVGAFIAGKLAEKRNIKKERAYDFLIWLIPFSLVFSRIGHVLNFWGIYVNDPIKMLYIWQGGLTFYGGLAGAIIAGLLFSRKYKIKFYDLADIFVIPLALGLALGRFANWINNEFYGKLSNLPWAINVPGVEGKRHPSQFYELIKNLIVFFVTLQMYKFKKLPSGFIFWFFIFFYSLLRFFVEFFKDWQIIAWNLNWAQLIAIPLIPISLYMLSKIYKGGKSGKEYEKD